MEHFEGFELPSYTAIPDLFFDYWLDKLHAAAIVAFLFICRRTLGFKRREAAVSLRMMLEGVVIDDRVVQVSTGLSKPTLLKGLRELVDKGLIVRVRQQRENGGDVASLYRVRFKGDSMGDSDVETPLADAPPVVKNLDHPPLVKNLDHPPGKKSLPRGRVENFTTHIKKFSNTDIQYSETDVIASSCKASPARVSSVANSARTGWPNPNLSPEDLDRALSSYLDQDGGGHRARLGEPDVEVFARIAAATHGRDYDHVVHVLRRVYQNGQRAHEVKKWSWFVSVFEAVFNPKPIVEAAAESPAPRKAHASSQARRRDGPQSNDLRSVRDVLKGLLR